MPVVLFDDFDDSAPWGWLHPLHDAPRKPLLGSHLTLTAAALALPSDAAPASPPLLKLRRPSAGQPAALTALSPAHIFLNGERIAPHAEAALCHADVLAVARADAAACAFRFCEAERELPELGAPRAADGAALLPPAREASAVSAELALLEAMQREVEAWSAAFEAAHARAPKHSEKLAGVGAYRVLERMKRQQRRSQGEAPSARQTRVTQRRSNEDYGLAEGEEATDGLGVAVDTGEEVTMPQEARWRFNKSPKEAVKWLCEEGAIGASGEDWTDAGSTMAKWFLQEEGLSKAKVGEFLGGNSPLQVATLQAFTRLLELSDLHLVAALRYYLSLFKLPGEAQIIDRILLAFAAQWTAANAASVDCSIIDSDVAYILSYSIVMLNTDLHNPQVVNKMTLEQWFRNNRGIGVRGADLPKQMLEELYNAIAKEEIKLEQREFIRTTNCEGWLVKRGGRVQTWKRRWVILSGSVLYYFEDVKNPEPKGLVPLEDVTVRSSSEKPFAFTLHHDAADGGKLKSAKSTKPGGAMQAGKHTSFVFAADSEEDRQRWMRAVRNEVQGTRWREVRGISSTSSDV
ncbi:hypothetical protein AB1Y20_007430 [Prymnesium parvum]|uniref:Uncharacterized protein n=1 Tax=Prymnesium parvum TaxID=97485 RepID=A0AB34IXG5_PRYPA